MSPVSTGERGPSIGEHPQREVSTFRRVYRAVGSWEPWDKSASQLRRVRLSFLALLLDHTVFR
jgi:hypothetical protein